MADNLDFPIWLPARLDTKGAAPSCWSSAIVDCPSLILHRQSQGLWARVGFRRPPLRRGGTALSLGFLGLSTGPLLQLQDWDCSSVLPEQDHVPCIFLSPAWLPGPLVGDVGIPSQAPSTLRLKSPHHKMWLWGVVSYSHHDHQ